MTSATQALRLGDVVYTHILLLLDELENVIDGI